MTDLRVGYESFCSIYIDFSNLFRVPSENVISNLAFENQNIS